MNELMTARKSTRAYNYVDNWKIDKWRKFKQTYCKKGLLLALFWDLFFNFEVVMTDESDDWMM